MGDSPQQHDGITKKYSVTARIPAVPQYCAGGEIGEGGQVLAILPPTASNVHPKNGRFAEIFQ
jgi:hypothetical protein